MKHACSIAIGPVLRPVLAALLAAVFVFQTIGASHAQRGRVSLIRDAEIEALVADYARPLLKASGLGRNSVRFLIANDPSFNAFVSGRNMVINTGLLMTAETPNEVIGVIAHEIGHIKGGHQQRLAERARSAKIFAGVATLLGVGAGIAGAASGSRDAASAGVGVALGGGNIALRGLLQYKREEEITADRAAATLLAKTGQSGAGMLQTFNRFNQALGLSGARVNPYQQSHPMPRERIQSLESVLSSSPHFNKKDPKSLQERHDMVRAKIAAYTAGGRSAQRILQDRNLSPVARSYGNAIITHLYGSPRKAVPMIDSLIKQRPGNAYLHEMKGEILLRAGKAREAVAPFRRAIKLDKTGAGFLRIELGHALVASGDRKSLEEAVTQLKRGLSQDANGAAGYQYLAIAYGQLGNEAEALLASAEFAARTGRKDDAKSFARRAQAKLKRGSPSWLRAGDILTY